MATETVRRSTLKASPLAHWPGIWKPVRMSQSQGEFVHRENMRRYRQELASTPVGPRRKMLLSLLAKEQSSADEQGWPPALG